MTDIHQGQEPYYKSNFSLQSLLAIEDLAHFLSLGIRLLRFMRLQEFLIP